MIKTILHISIFSSTILLFSCNEQNSATKENVTIQSKNQLKLSETLCVDTTATKKNISSNLTIKPTSKNPIIAEAYNNPHFSAKKWLKSDISFYKQSSLTQISSYDKIIKKMARRYGFDWRLIAAQIYTESNFKNNATSHVGALGLMQIMPKTAQFMGFDPHKMTKPEINIAVGCMYNQRMYNLWGRQTKDKKNRLAFAFASYNAGRGRVLKSFDTSSGLTSWKKVHPNLPIETQSYVHKIYLKYDLYCKHILP